MPKSVIGFSPCPLGRHSGGKSRDNSRINEADNHSEMFQYPEFVVAYESGVDQVARFDASIEIFGDAKTVKVCIDTPFVKGLPTTMIVKETLPDGSYRESTTRRTYEDSFTLELQEVYQWVVEGKTPKTSPTDARQDLEVLGMPMKAVAA